MSRHIWTHPASPPKLNFMALKHLFGLCGLAVLLLGSAPDNSSSTGTAQLYRSGVRAYQNQNFKKSRQNFRDAWRNQPNNKFILYNWGLSEFQLGNKGQAVAAWRRALSLDPGFSAVQKALKFAKEKMAGQKRFENPSGWESFRQEFLTPISGRQLLIVTALLLAAGGWLAILYWTRRRTALQRQRPLPAFPWGTVAVILGFVVSLVLTLLKGYDFLQPRATVVTSVEVKSAPNKKSTTLFELNEGVEVIIKEDQKNWTQVSYPGGMTGWVPNQSVFTTSGYKIW